jgi:tetratricopeptide (TPR) repeat protein
MRKIFALILLLLLAVLCTLASGQPVGSTSDSLILRSGDATDPWKPCWTHGAWGNPIGDPEAKWTWATQQASNPERGETQTYIREFYIDGDPIVPIDGTLTITADNGYTATLNNVELGSGHDWGSAQTYKIGNELYKGKNTLKIKVTNDPVPQSNPQTNPAGLIYKIEASWENSGLAGGGVPPELGVILGRITEYDQDPNASSPEPTTVEGWNIKGIALYKQGKYDEAIDAFNQALTLTQFDEVTLLNLGAAYEAKGDIDHAIQIYEKVALIGGPTEEAMRAKISELKNKANPSS